MFNHNRPINSGAAYTFHPPTTHPAMAHPVAPHGPSSSLYAEKAPLMLQMARQRALAAALRGGGNGGVAPPPTLGVTRAAGLPSIR